MLTAPLLPYFTDLIIAVLFIRLSLNTAKIPAAATIDAPASVEDDGKLSRNRKPSIIDQTIVV